MLAAGAAAAVVTLASCGGSLKPQRSAGGALAVTVGTRNGARSAAVQVTGPRGYRRRLTATATLAGLAPGRYTVVAAPARTSSASWWPPSVTQAVAVRAGRTAAVDDVYQVKVPATTRVLASGALVSEAPIRSAIGSGDVVLSAAAATGLRPGDILTAGTSALTPDGLLRKVVSVARDGANAVVSTVPATLREAVPVGAISATIGANARVMSDSTSGAPPSSVELVSTYAYSSPSMQALWAVNKNVACGSVGSFALDGSFNLKPTGMTFKVGWGRFGIRSAKFALGFRESSSIGLHVHGGLACRWSTNQPSVPISPPIDLQAGPVPVVVVLEWNMGESVTASETQDAAFGLSQQATAQLGLQWANGTLKAIADLANRSSPVTPQGTQVSATGAVGPRFQLAIYGQAGPYVSISLFGTGQITSATASARGQATIQLGIEAGAGFRVNALGIDWGIPNILKYSRTIYSAPLPHSAPISPQRGAGSCSDAALFQAAVTKEHLDIHAAGYGGTGPHGLVNPTPGATGAVCDAGWAVAFVSRPRVGYTDGDTLFRKQAGTWTEVAQLGVYPHLACTLSSHGVPGSVIAALAAARSGRRQASDCGGPRPG